MPCLTAWAESLGGIAYPLLSDFWPHGAAAASYGLFNPAGHSERAIVILDAGGVIRSLEVFPPEAAPDEEALFGRLAEITGLREEPRKPEAQAPPPVAGPSGLVLYCSSWCPDCRRAREWLRSKGIPFTEVDIYRDEAAASRVRGWTGGKMVTPTFDCGGTVVVRFDRERLETILSGQVGG